MDREADISRTRLSSVLPSGRVSCRSALAIHWQGLEGFLSKILCSLKLDAGDRLIIHLVGSLAEEYASGVLVDVAHLIRLQAQDIGLHHYTLQSLLLLPEAHATASTGFDEQVRLQQIAAATWRELDRFQLVFEHTYPLLYGGRRTERKGKLLDRCYLLSPDRSGGPSFVGMPSSETLFPAMADIVIALADAAFNPAWEQVAQAAANRAGEQQLRRGEVLYSSAGCFTYILPVEDLVEHSALQLAREMIAVQMSGELPNPRDAAVAFLSQPASTTGVLTTALMQDAAQCAKVSQEEARERVASLGVETAALLSPSRDDETRQQVLQFLHNLSKDGVAGTARTSAEAQADQYGPDTTRFIQEVERATTQSLAALDAYLETCQKSQVAVFHRLLAERFLEILNPSTRDVGGLMPALDLGRALITLLKDYKQVVAAARAYYDQLLKEAQSEADSLRRSVEEEAERCKVGHPQIGKALLSGVVPAAAVVIGLGVAILAIPPLFIPLGVVALAAVGAGTWGSWYALHRTPRLIRQQIAYRQAAQQIVALDIQQRLYSAWERIVEEWLETVRAATEPFEAWEAAWRSSELLQSLTDAEKALQTRRQARQAIRVRRYIDDDRVWEMLHQRHVKPIVQKDNSNNRFIWSCGPNGGCWKWRLTTVGTQKQALDEPDGKGILDMVMDIGQAYASVLRSLRVADVLAELETAESVAKECESGSAPLIRIAANEQPLSEAHRFVAVAGEQRAAYFDQVVHTLRQPAAQNHSEQRAPLSHPYRCLSLASLDLLRTAGISSWQQARDSYKDLRRLQRQALHLFAAERNAVYYEGLLPQVHLSPHVFSPQTALTMEDEKRARLFWLAYAYGWVQTVKTEPDSMSRLCHMALVLPDTKPIPLTEPHDEEPSLWRACVAYVLGERGGDAESIETAIAAFEPADRAALRAQVRQLESALDKAKQLQQNRNIVTREMGMVLQLILEDRLRQLEGEPRILEA